MAHNVAKVVLFLVFLSSDMVWIDMCNSGLQSLVIKPRSQTILTGYCIIEPILCHIPRMKGTSTLTTFSVATVVNAEHC